MQLGGVENKQNSSRGKDEWEAIGSSGDSGKLERPRAGGRGLQLLTAM